MSDLEKFEKLKQNILSLDWSMDDAPYHGITGEFIKTVRFALNDILKGTGITFESLIQEMNEKGWFQHKPE